MTSQQSKPVARNANRQTCPRPINVRPAAAVATATATARAADTAWREDSDTYYWWLQWHVLVRIAITATYVAKSAYPWILCNWIVGIFIAVIARCTKSNSMRFLLLFFFLRSSRHAQFNNIFNWLASEVNAQFFVSFFPLFFCFAAVFFLGLLLFQPVGPLLNCDFSSADNFVFSSRLAGDFHFRWRNTYNNNRNSWRNAWIFCVVLSDLQLKLEKETAREKLHSWNYIWGDKLILFIQLE